MDIFICRYHSRRILGIYELGWGGYWAWDPVENSSLMPWLILTAFIHSSMIQEKSQDPVEFEKLRNETQNGHSFAHARSLNNNHLSFNIELIYFSVKSSSSSDE